MMMRLAQVRFRAWPPHRRETNWFGVSEVRHEVHGLHPSSTHHDFDLGEGGKCTLRGLAFLIRHLANVVNEVDAAILENASHEALVVDKLREDWES